MNGPFDYNATTIAPPGIKTLVYETPQQRKTWDQQLLWCLVYRVLSRPLPLPQDIRPGNPGRTNLPHCFIFPAWFCSPSKQSPGWHSSLDPGSENCAPTLLTAHSSTTCWGQTICCHTRTGKYFLPKYSTSNNPSAYPSNSGTPRNFSSCTTNTTIHLSWPLSYIIGTSWKQRIRT